MNGNTYFLDFFFLKPLLNTYFSVMMIYPIVEYVCFLHKIIQRGFYSSHSPVPWNSNNFCTTVVAVL